MSARKRRGLKSFVTLS